LWGHFHYTTSSAAVFIYYDCHKSHSVVDYLKKLGMGEVQFRKKTEPEASRSYAKPNKTVFGYPELKQIGSLVRCMVVKLEYISHIVQPLF
jgi:hypothetical protein